jgi:hypothetical protein
MAVYGQRHSNNCILKGIIELANSMEHSFPWQANSRSASQEIINHLWNPNVHYRVRNSPTPLPILSKINPDYTLFP